jgi:hypothetical protein
MTSRKDPDGFMDIEWCETKVINSWNHLREEFQKANARKAIAPTQFNPMSTRGHCIMVLEVEMPHPENEGAFYLRKIFYIILFSFIFLFPKKHKVEREC